MLAKIFLFHRVHPQRDLLWDPISPAKFEQIINYLTKKYQVLGLEEFLAGEKNKSSKEKVMITFDDGYKDFIEYAFPILKKYNCPASMYVISDCAEKKLPPWTYILDYLMIHSNILEINMDTAMLPMDLRENKWKTKQERMIFAKKFKFHLKFIPDSLRKLFFDQVCKSLNDIPIPENMMMNWEEIVQIHKEGCEIGSHSVSHPILAKIEKEEDLLMELVQSRNVIKEKLGVYPSTISYPIGGYNKRVMLAAKQAGYKYGLAVKENFYYEGDDLFEIPRVQLYNENIWKSKLRMNGILTKAKRIFRNEDYSSMWA